MSKYTADSKSSKMGKRWLSNFEKLVSAGVPPLHAARTLKVSRTTFYAWLEHIETHRESGQLHPCFVEFSDILERGQAEAIAFCILEARRRISSTSDALKFLAKIAPDEFGDDGAKMEDENINQLLVGIVRGMTERSQAALEESETIDADFEEL
jgi:hypothetical protein